MKKLSELAALALGVALAFGFAACDNGSGDSTTTAVGGNDTTQTDGTAQTDTSEEQGGADGESDTLADPATDPAAPSNPSDPVTPTTPETPAAPTIPGGFVEVTGATVSGAVSGSQVFITDRTVAIDDLYVSDHEVTQAEYEAFCKYGNDDMKPTEDFGAGDDFPAYYVSWYDAIVYCNLRSMDEGLKPVYQLNDETDPAKWTDIVSETTDGVTKYCAPEWSDAWDSITMVGSGDDTVTTADGYRLPTEAEWEYIAREANTSTTAYSGSDTVGDVAWYRDNSKNKTHAVKTKPANGLDIYDMSGNVWEWCWDWFDSVSASTAATGSASGDNRVLRGGSWYDSADSCAMSSRNVGGPNCRYSICGFRVVRSSSK